MERANETVSERPFEQEIQEKIRQKKFFDRLYFILVSIPALIYLALHFADETDLLETYLTVELVGSWLIVYFVLVLLQSRVWRCPRCEHSLSRWYDRNQLTLARACRHCGLALMEPLPVPEGMRALTGVVSGRVPALRPGFLIVVLGLALLSIGIGIANLKNTTFAVPPPLLIIAGGAVLVLCLIAYFALRGALPRSCHSCGRLGQTGKFCDNCGTSMGPDSSELTH